METIAAHTIRKVIDEIIIYSNTCGFMHFRAEASELSGLGLDCPKSCAYCCLCPPGLLDGEVDRIVGACEDSKAAFGADRIGDSEHAVQVQGDRGACSFLNDRRCKVYASRPHFCRQYPVMVYSGWRVQLSAIRSCRGVVPMGDKKGPKAKTANTKARPLIDIFNSELEQLGEQYFAETLEETISSFEEIKDHKDIYATPEEVQRSAMHSAAALGNAKALCKLQGIDRPDEGRARESIVEIFWQDIESAFTCPDIIDLPVYNRPDRGWEVFRLVGSGEMSAYTLLENGQLTYELTKPVVELKLRSMDAGAKKVLKQYLQLAFKRDVFFGMVARESLVSEMPMKELASDLGTGIATDLWWRAGLLSAFGAMAHPKKGPSPTGPLDAMTAKEAVIFMDADLLDSYALGAII
jgi:Fe-S-cluster containining protein